MTDIRQRIAEIHLAHQSVVGYQNTGTTSDDRQYWFPGCDCDWLFNGSCDTEDAAQKIHAAHVADVLVTELGLHREVENWYDFVGGPRARYVTPWELDQ